jgi:hypothetical protein
LAKLGDLLTPENYIDELHFNEVLDQTIARAHGRLMKYQASRARKSAANVNSLQPGWVADKHWRHGLRCSTTCSYSSSGERRLVIDL